MPTTGPGWWCCCDTGDCIIFEDLFNRANSTNLGTDWEEIDADHWSIDTNQLLNDGQGIALVTATIPIVQGYHVSVRTVDEGSSGNWRIVMNYDPVTGDYYYANLARTDADNCTLSVGHHDGTTDVDTEIDSESTGDWRPAPAPPCPEWITVDQTPNRAIYCCLSSRGIYAQTGVLGVPYIIYYTVWGPLPATLDISLSRVGLASLSGSPTRFDHFDLQRDTTSLTLCDDCPCHCGTDGYVSHSKTLLLTIINTVGTCASLEGLQFTLYRQQASSAQCSWHGSITIEFEYGPVSHCAELILDGDPIPTGTLGFFEIWNACLPTKNADPGGSCNPVNMTFDGVNIGQTYPPPWGPFWNCGCHTSLGPGSFDWALTEAP